MNAPATIHFATSNPDKIREARGLLPAAVEPLELDLLEIQAATLDAICRHKLTQAMAKVPGPVFVEDVALGFEALGGFPGAYVKWLLEASGGEGLGRIAAGLGAAAATAICHVAFWDGSNAHSFVGRCSGQILTEPRGNSGFGWDPWFIPAGESKTFAEMDSELKARVSHRAIAYQCFSEFLRSTA